MSNGQQQDSMKMKPGDGLQLLCFIAGIHQAAIGPIIRKGYGTQALGLPALLAMISIWVLYAVTADVFVFWYFWRWMGALIYRRIETHRLLRKGAEIHSRYEGTPILALRLKWFKESTIRGFIEPFYLLVLGAFLCY